MRDVEDEAQSGSQSVARALSILMLLSGSTARRGVREIAREFDLAPSIVQRLLSTLSEFGFVEQSDVDRKYRIGVNAFRVGKTYLSANDYVQASLPEMQELAGRHNLNMFLGVLNGDRVVYLAALQSSGPITIRSVPGSTAFLHSTAFGKAFLADMPEVDAKRLLGREPYGRLASKTKTTWRQLVPELRRVRKQGYAVADAENLENVFAVGALLWGASGTPVASISAALPRAGLTAAERKRCCTLVTDAAVSISRKLGAPEEALASMIANNRPEKFRALA